LPLLKNISRAHAGRVFQKIHDEKARLAGAEPVDAWKSDSVLCEPTEIKEILNWAQTFSCCWNTPPGRTLASFFTR